MMDSASTSETSINFYQTTRRSNPEDRQLHTRRRQNLKSHLRIGPFVPMKEELTGSQKELHNEELYNLNQSF
jgi:hypothetical protein